MSTLSVVDSGRWAISEQEGTKRDSRHPVSVSETERGSAELTYSPVNTSFPVSIISVLFCAQTLLSLNKHLWHTTSPVARALGLGLGSFRKSGSTSGTRFKPLKG